MIAGNYREALVPLGKLFNNGTPAIQAAALYKASTCHKYLCDYTTATALLQKIIAGNFPDDIRGNALFERASVYQNLLHDGSNALIDLRRYTREFRNGLWAEEASYSLAELLFQFQDYRQAAQEYQRYCNTFTKTNRTEKALYKLGIIYANNLSDPQNALKTFTRLILEFPQTQFSEDAVFWSADCLLRLGLTNRALNEFNTYVKRYPNGKWLTEAKTRLKRIETAEAR